MIGSGAAVAELLQPEAPAEAIVGVFEVPTVTNYTVLDAFTVGAPSDFRPLQNETNSFRWQVDPIQPLQQYSAAAKVVSYTSLAEALGANATEYGERLAAKRPWGGATLLETLVDPGDRGLDVYQYEFESEKIHEILLFALIKRGSENVLCNMAARTPSLLWVDRDSLFRQLMATFVPLEPQPQRKFAPVAPTSALLESPQVPSMPQEDFLKALPQPKQAGVAKPA